MPDKDDYFDGFGKPVLRTSYCAFLDVLGYTARVLASEKEGSGNALLQEFHGVLSERVQELKDESSDSLLYFKSLTDNVILAHPRFSEDMESEFAFILWSLRRYQFQMAKKGFFIRGGLSVGALFVDENSVYGPALIEAYHLENKVAVNPIVVLSDDAMGLSLHHTGYYAGESSPQEEDILVGADGRFFLNYLVECVDDSDFPTVNWADLLLHKTQVESALNEYKGDLHVFAKYAWLAAYHNYFCESKKHLVGYSDQVKISSSLAATSFRRLSQVKAKKAGKA